MREKRDEALDTVIAAGPTIAVQREAAGRLWGTAGEARAVTSSPVSVVVAALELVQRQPTWHALRHQRAEVQYLGVEQGLAICRASGDWTLLRPTVASLGYAYVLRGRLAEGRTLLEEGIQEGLHRGEVGNQACWVAWLSEVCRLTGHDKEAWQPARQALALTRQIKNRKDEVRALHQLGTLHAHTVPPDAERAEAFYRQALTLAEELGMRPLQAHCHRGLAHCMPREASESRPGPRYRRLSRCTEIWR